MSNKSKEVLIFVVGLGAGLIFREHPFTWTIGMLGVFAFFFAGLGIFIGWKQEPPLWLRNIFPSLN